MSGCQSTSGRNGHTCSIYLESTDSSSIIKTLPISKIDIPVIPVPILFSDGIASADLVPKRCGMMLNISFTDRAAYELYHLSFDSIGRRLVLEYDGDIIGFSKISDENIQNLTFIPEISDEACQAFCRFINCRR